MNFVVRQPPLYFVYLLIPFSFSLIDLIGSELLQQLLSGVCAFFTARSREVVKSALEFIKVSY